MERTKKMDCQCEFCKNHICHLNFHQDKCIHKYCERYK